MTAPETLLGLLERYSPSGQETEAVNYLVEHMSALGYSRAYIDKVGNAIGIMGEGEQQIVLLGHIDTVPGEIPVRQEGDLIHGRGSVDAKGPLAAFVDTVAEVGELSDYQFVVIGAVGEESESIGARHILDKFHPAMAIIGEPSTWNRITLGYKGSAQARITSRQSTAHSAGENKSAAEKVVEDWLHIQKWALAYNADQPRVFDQVSPTISSMTSHANGFEETASLDLSFRLPLSMNPEALYEKLGKTLIYSQYEERGYPIPAHLSGKNNPLVRAFLRAIRKQGGQPRFVRKTGTADMNIVAPAWDCPILAYGPGDSSLDHTPNEHISIEEFGKAVKVLVSTLAGLAA